MSLIIYLDVKDLPKVTSFVRRNDSYFDFRSKIVDCSALRDVEQAKFLNESYYYGKFLGYKSAVSKTELSTGMKTYFNISQHPNTIFDTIECGGNIMLHILKLTSGMILYRAKLLPSFDDVSCDIVCKDKHFDDLHEFFSWRKQYV